MTYNETLHYLYNQMPEYQRIGSLAYKPGLDNSLALDKLFGNPHNKFKTIHIGGTNGKGSTSHLLAAILQKSGYKTGLYTSPHLVDFRERIRVNRKMIDKEFVTQFVEKHKDQFEPIMPSFFELTMEMAFLYFAMQKVDVAIVEVGLGGRLDSTNIISPQLSIITNIGHDHEKFLGSTLPEIASEKAGIIKHNTPVVIGETDDEAVKQVFVKKAAQENAPIVFADTYFPDFLAERKNNKWLYNTQEYPNLVGSLGGYAQERNAKTVLTAVSQLKNLGYAIPKTAVYEGFEQVASLTGLNGRWQILQNNPTMVCDTGHNAHGIRYIAEQLKNERYYRLHMVFGMVNDKDVDAVLQLLPKDAIYYFTKPLIERALNEAELAQAAAKYGLQGKSYNQVVDAIEAAKTNADKNDFIFIGGSSFVVADALQSMGELPD